MPSTGTSSSSMAGSAGGASASYTEHGPPDRMIPSGFCARTCSMGAVQGSTTENTFCSRMRRAISCVYCEPKSRMTIEEVSIGQGIGNRVQGKDYFTIEAAEGTGGMILDAA